MNASQPQSRANLADPWNPWKYLGSSLCATQNGLPADKNSKSAVPKMESLLSVDGDDKSSHLGGPSGSGFLMPRNPLCARCRNHGKRSGVKGHSRDCEFKDCNCNRCKLINDRRKVMAKQLSLRRRRENETREWKIRCARCRNHGRRSRFEGHKWFCEWTTCQCEKCKLIKDRQFYQKN